MSMHLEDTSHSYARGNVFLTHEKLADFVFILSIASFSVCNFRTKIM